eukprot:NODE_9_length_47730_cov_0.323718.p5 type:complete len:524 gc:universal NODE_9_length_47730_cov_0.323718:41427-42998(+)
MPFGLYNDVQYLCSIHQVLLIYSSMSLEDISNALTPISPSILIIEFSKSFIYSLFVDPNLSKYNIVILKYKPDIFMDLSISLLKRILSKRSNLKLIIYNSTAEMKSYFNNPGILEFYTNECDVYYLDQPCSNIVNSITFTIKHLLKNDSAGTVLVFCPGINEISQIKNDLQADSINVQVCQGAAIPSFTKSRIVLTSNAGIAADYVVDSGVTRNVYYDGVCNTLITEHISDYEANIRSRFANTKLFRLYTQAEYNAFTKSCTNQQDYAQLVYLLLCLKCKNPVFFDYFNKPNLYLLNCAVVQLFQLSFINSCGLLDNSAETFKEVPLHPRYLRVVSSAFDFKCLVPVLKMISMCHVKELFLTKNRKQLEQVQEPFKSEHGDLHSYLNIFDLFLKNGDKWSAKHSLNTKELNKAVRLYKKCKAAIKAATKVDFSASQVINNDSIKKSFIDGFFMNVMVLDGIRYKRLDDIFVDIHPNSVLYNDMPKWCIYIEGLKTSKLFVQHVMTVDWKCVRDKREFYEFKST